MYSLAKVQVLMVGYTLEKQNKDERFIDNGSWIFLMMR